MCRLRYFARSARAPLRVGQASFLPTMAKNSFRGARTPHRGGAHNALLNPAPAPHICAYLRSSRQGAFCGQSATPKATLVTPVAPLHENILWQNILVIAGVQFKRVKAAMLYCCYLSPQRGERVRYAVRREAAHEHSRSTAPVGLRRMRELRNCRIKGNFVTETALSIGAVETNARSAVGLPAGCLSISRLFLSSV